MEYVITDDVTLNDAISYATEIYDPAILWQFKYYQSGQKRNVIQ